MEIFKFINSKDIREYLKEQNYQFNSLETAWLIYQCESLSFEDKKKYFLELIDSMPDCEMPIRNDNCISGRLHQVLKDYINKFEEVAREFEEETSDAVYSYQYLYKGDSSYCEEYDTPYKTYSDCLAAFNKEMEDYTSDEKANILYYNMKRIAFGATERCTIKYFLDGRIMNIEDYYKKDDPEDEWTKLDPFFGLWFNFPTPFKKGDIVWVPKLKEFIKYNMDGPVVLEHLSCWDDVNQYIREHGDINDMYYSGLFVNPNGTVYHETSQNYMDLEYYREEFTKNEKVLIPISRYMQGKITMEVLICTYRELILKLESDEAMIYSWLSYYDPLLTELGLK